MVSKTEYQKAVKKSGRIIAFFQITENRRASVRISKKSALKMAANLPDDAAIAAEFVEGYLFVGGYQH